MAEWIVEFKEIIVEVLKWLNKDNPNENVIYRLAFHRILPFLNTPHIKYRLNIHFLGNASGKFERQINNLLHYNWSIDGKFHL